jgi:hypothetical protein
MPTILGGLYGITTAGTTSFEVLVSPPSPSLTDQVVGHCSRLSKTPSGTGAQVEASIDRSSATAFSAQGMWCRSRTSKSFFQLVGMEQVGGQLGVIVAAFPLNLFDDQLGVALHQQLSDPKG